MNQTIVFCINGGKNDKSANNTGNLVIWDSLISHINADLIIKDSINSLPNYDIKDGSTILIPFASCLNNVTRVEPLVDFIKKKNIKPVLIGIGIQSEKYYILNFHPSLIELLRITSERSYAIGVRGYYTANILNRLGINNVKVIGCPSIFFRGENFKVNNRNYKDIKKTALHTTYYTPEKSGLEYLINIGKDNNSNFIAQNEFKLIQLIKSGDKKTPELSKEILNYCSDDKNFDLVLSYFKNNDIELFYDTDQWRSKVKKEYDFVYGTRFHGNIISLQAGVPAFFISCDYRTLDMCEFLRLPYLDIESLKILKPSLEDMSKLANYDEFNKIYPKLYLNYIQFLEKSNIPHLLKYKSQNKDIIYTSDLNVPTKFKARLKTDDREYLLDKINETLFKIKKIMKSKSFKFSSIFFKSLKRKIVDLKSNLERM